MIRIIIPGVPLPWKAPYVGTHGAFSPRYEAAKIIKSLIRQQYDGPVLDGYFWVDLFFYMPIPKSISKKKRQMMIDGKIRPESGGDRTNLSKFYEDLLQGIVIKNDKKIVDGRVAKWYGEEPKTVINLQVIE